MKFRRIFILIGAGLLGITGAISATVIAFIIMASTKTLSGGRYLYPLIPFNPKALKRLIFRTQK
jgi:stage V sporulation protein AF